MPTNHLANESSPYLLMHATNPVNWYPWSDKTLEIAKAENKLMIISIGYAACHWCHVMEQESFSDTEVADVMNKSFISIKVDREERPDIDKIYMDAAQLISGRGGWPLNAIALPDGRPVYAATYFPKQQWLEVLGKIQWYFENEQDMLIRQAEELTKGIVQNNSFFIHPQSDQSFKTIELHEVYKNIIENIDFKFGGLNTSPKFPMPAVFEFLLHYYHETREKKALDAVTITLDKMASGGIYDHIGGGFARYSTDKYWRVPHFEKMLYDNAQLVSLYSNAYKITKNEVYKQVVEETLEFVHREMTSSQTGFYSAIDADSEHEEGKFYVWNYDEVDNILSDDEKFVIDYFSVEKNGNWEHGKNILIKSGKDELFAHAIKLTENDFKYKLSKIKARFLQQRNATRIRPMTDTKIIVSWNALMIRGYLDAFTALGNKQYLNAAIKNASFIRENLITNEGQLNRNFKDGRIYANAMLDDYAFLIEAFTSLYQVTFDESWLDWAKKMLEYTINHFFDTNTGMFFYTSDIDLGLITRQFEITDQVIPSSNSVMALNLFYIGTYFSNSKYLEMSSKMLLNVQESISKSTAYFANWAKLNLLLIKQPFEIALLGQQCFELNLKLQQHFLPNVIVSGSSSESNLPLLKNKWIKDQTNIYVCKDKICNSPTTELEEVLKELSVI
jgi:uncharacterized protein YyaL (SSP411 family)